MLKIDGSYGEGGGQILRSSLGLSAYTGKPFEMFNIRAERSNPGLSHQHLKCVEAMKELVNASVEGNELRSKKLKFVPREPSKNDIAVDIKTAGSVSLLLHCIFPLIPKMDDELRVEVIGGTDVKWSPPFDYLKNVTLYFLEKIGIDNSIKLLRRGYYPKGKGKVVFKGKGSLKNSFSFTKDEGVESIRGVSFSSNLPKHVAERQKKAALEDIRENLDNDINVSIQTTQNPKAIGKGSGIVLWTNQNKRRLGASSLGEPGKPAEEVGSEAAEELIDQINKKGCLDKYMADQIIPFLGMTNESTVSVTEVTSHAKTNSWVVSKFLNKEVGVK